ncbi:MAG: aconitase X catalytic domain-containing protein [Deltaproteobacteria bacterium]|nr:aconitase X catalytic domain-containing protein [Deltaproteobacteria bacterium]
MKLTDYDKALLSGDHGEAARIGMRVLVDMAENMGADEMISISMVHDDSAWFEGLAGLEFAEHLLKLGGRFVVPTSLNSCLMDLEKWQTLRFDPDLYIIHKRIEAAHTGLGAAGSWTCAPYFAGFVPRFGEQVAWAESNATAYVNSIIGARTERYAGLMDLCAALTGRVPYLGLHKPENRRATVLLKLEGIKDEYFQEDSIYDCLGYIHGETVGDRIGAMEGLPPWSKIDGLKRFSATAASSGGVGLFHLIGLTPEAHTREMAFHGQKPADEVVVTLKTLRDVQERISPGRPREISMINTGCPHLSYAECVELLKLFAGRQVKRGLEFWAYTNRSNKKHMMDCGLYEALTRYGIKIYTDGCPMASPWHNWDFKGLMSNSGKFCTYCYSYSGIHPVHGSLSDCVETAVSGQLTRSSKPWS